MSNESNANDVFQGRTFYIATIRGGSSHKRPAWLILERAGYLEYSINKMPDDWSSRENNIRPFLWMHGREGYRTGKVMRRAELTKYYHIVPADEAQVATKIFLDCD